MKKGRITRLAGVHANPLERRWEKAGDVVTQAQTAIPNSPVTIAAPESRTAVSWMGLKEGLHHRVRLLWLQETGPEPGVGLNRLVGGAGGPLTKSAPLSERLSLSTRSVFMLDEQARDG